jgi:phosphoglycolate phosphatase
VNDKSIVVAIFDFDGTIADSLLATLNVLYRLVHHQPLPKEDISELRGMGFMRVLHRLRIPYWRAALLIRQTRQGLTQNINSLEVVFGVDTAIKTLAKDCQLFIVSSNDEASIRKFLKRHALERYFAGVIGKANFWDKSHALKRLLREHRLSPDDTWYVGDRIWDVRSARRAGLKSIAVSWGYSNIHVLERGKPNVLVFDADELVDAVRGKRYGK